MFRDNRRCGAVVMQALRPTPGWARGRCRRCSPRRSPRAICAAAADRMRCGGEARCAAARSCRTGTSAPHEDVRRRPHGACGGGRRPPLAASRGDAGSPVERPWWCPT